MRRPLTMDFFVAVPTHEAGEAVSARVTPLGFSTKVDQDDETGDWTCYCTKDLIPELKAVLAVEEQLDRIGQEVGGYADGFGTYGNGGRLS